MDYCYLVAKKFHARGSVCLKVLYGKELVELHTFLTAKILDKNIEILTVSSLEGYGEYAPYHEVLTKEEFIKFENIYVDF